MRWNSRTRQRISAPRLLSVVLLVVGLTLTSAPAPAAQAATILVVTKTIDTNDGSCNSDCSLREATIAANTTPGPNTITLPGGVYILSLSGQKEDVGSKGDLDITDNLTLTGAGADSTIVDGGAIDTVFDIPVTGAVVEMSALTIRNGMGFGVPGGVSNKGTLTIHDCVISGNQSLGSAGGGFWNSGRMAIDNCTISGNLASGNGGGGQVRSGKLAVTNSTISNNVSQAFGGGGLAINGGSISITNSTISGNSAAVKGGGLDNEPPLGTVTLNNVTISGNTAPNGAGVSNDFGGTVTLNNSHVISNTATVAGGGGLANGGVMALNGSTIQGNIAESSDGGGVYNIPLASLTLNGTLVDSNTSGTGQFAFSGGGIFNAGTLKAVGSTISNNNAPATNPGYGGGLYSTGAATLVNVTVSSNFAHTLGGGIYSTGTLAITNGTIASNNGMGLNNGIINTSDTSAALRNSIVAYNATTGSIPADCLGPISSGGSNLSLDPLCASGGIGDLVADPLLGPLANNGGPTPTRRIEPGSPALDAVLGECPSPGGDQRGVPRPQGLRCDIGAFEYDVHLVFTTQPGGKPAGEPLKPQPVVKALDTFGKLSSIQGQVALSLLPDTGTAGAHLTGNTSVSLNRGTAVFTNVAIDTPGSGYRLVASTEKLPGAQSAPINITGPVPPIDQLESEIETNDTITDANELVFDTNNHAARRGAIGNTMALSDDLDLFTFTARAGASVMITLTNLPADYDIMLLFDPRVTIPISDDIDLSNITDLGRGSIGRGSIGRGSIGRGSIGRGSISGLSDNTGTDDESIFSYLTQEGQYFIIVYSAEGFDSSGQYRLDLSIEEGALEQPPLKAQPASPLEAAPDPAARTIFLYNSARMAVLYPDQPDETAELINALSPGGLLMLDSAGVGIDLSLSPLLAPDNAGNLEALYHQWDEKKDQPLFANEVAQQIWYVLDDALTHVYTGTTDVVLIGGDSVIPFYRVPDETTFANEGDYAGQLNSVINQNTPLAGSLRYRFIQTDDFYVDREPTPWRGRALFLPDLGIGRLVEKPTGIMHYLNSYLADGKYVIEADSTSPAGAALVTGYDFLTDEANTIAGTYVAYGLPDKGQNTNDLGTQYTLNTLISDSWDVPDLTNLWFTGQLPQLTGPQPYSGIHTNYHLTSLNAHFTHYDTEPALTTSTSTFAADQLLNPQAADDAEAFFKLNGGPTLIYSVGCQSGLSATDSAFSNPHYQADFAQAVLKQGGNWIGNTGYGYGDTTVIGYSERLSVLFTSIIGQRVGENEGAPIGLSLARAKRQYLLTNGSSSFSVFDEKALIEMALYGLPFIRVRVPIPAEPTLDSIPQPIPSPVRAQLTSTGGLFTRVITLTQTFKPLGEDGIPRLDQVHVQDSFVDNPPPVVITDQVSQGRPVLPSLAYDLTLQGSGISSTGEVPEPRGVRLRSATMLPDLGNYDPHVTTTITEDLDTQPDNSDLQIADAWLPTLPYTFQRLTTEGVGGEVANDRLLINPALFHGSSSEEGELRRFTQMVFEISYIDPQSAAAETLEHTTPPIFDDVQISPTSQIGSMQLRAAVQDSEGSSLASVSATYTTDGINWQRVKLQPDGTNTFSAVVPAAPGGARPYAYFEALDNAGNAAIDAAKGSLGSFEVVYLPMTVR